MDKQIALVTGGSSGIGRCLCLKLISEGYQSFLHLEAKSARRYVGNYSNIG